MKINEIYPANKELSPSKRKLNAIYGMMATDPVRAEWSRDALQTGIDIAGSRFVYCDTDCMKVALY